MTCENDPGCGHSPTSSRADGGGAIPPSGQALIIPCSSFAAGAYHPARVASTTTQPPRWAGRLVLVPMIRWWRMPIDPACDRLGPGGHDERGSAVGCQARRQDRISRRNTERTAAAKSADASAVTLLPTHPLPPEADHAFVPERVLPLPRYPVLASPAAMVRSASATGTCFGTVGSGGSTWSAICRRARW